MGGSVGFGPVRVSKSRGRRTRASIGVGHHVRVSAGVGGGRKGGRRRGSFASDVAETMSGFEHLAQVRQAQRAAVLNAAYKAQAEKDAPIFDQAQAAGAAAGQSAFYEAYNAEMARSGDRHVASELGSTAYKPAYDIAFYDSYREHSGFKVDPTLEARIADRDGMPESAAAWREMAEQGIEPTPAAGALTYDAVKQRRRQEVREAQQRHLDEVKARGIQRRDANRAKRAERKAATAALKAARKQRWAEGDYFGWLRPSATASEHGRHSA